MKTCHVLMYIVPWLFLKLIKNCKRGRGDFRGSDDLKNFFFFFLHRWDDGRLFWQFEASLWATQCWTDKHRTWQRQIYQSLDLAHLLCSVASWFSNRMVHSTSLCACLSLLTVLSCHSHVLPRLSFPIGKSYFLTFQDLWPEFRATSCFSNAIRYLNSLWNLWAAVVLFTFALQWFYRKPEGE